MTASIVVSRTPLGYAWLFAAECRISRTPHLTQDMCVRLYLYTHLCVSMCDKERKRYRKKDGNNGYRFLPVHLMFECVDCLCHFSHAQLVQSETKQRSFRVVVQHKTTQKICSTWTALAEIPHSFRPHRTN